MSDGDFESKMGILNQYFKIDRSGKRRALDAGTVYFLAEINPLAGLPVAALPET